MSSNKFNKAPQNTNTERKPISDPRFKRVETDPRFKRIHSDKAKLKVDKRFASMFTDKRFQLSAKHDARGRKAVNDQQEDYKKFYELEEEEEEKEENENQEEETPEEEDRDVMTKSKAKKNITKQQIQEEDDEEPQFSNAIYEGFSESSSDDESDFSDDQAEIDADLQDNEEKEEIEVGDATTRIAVMNCDWDKLKAVDLLMIFRSFLPPGGVIKSCTVYPSDYGMEQIAKEKSEGPKLWDGDENVNEEDEEVKSKIALKLRQYELNKLKYYFAVIEFETIKTSSLVYEQCDGLEIERTSNILDLRYIPDEVSFKDRKPRDKATTVPHDYKAPNFYTAALQTSNIECSWDQNQHERVQLTTKKFSKEDIKENDFKAYLASSSDSEADELPEENLPETDFSVENPQESEPPKKIKEKVREKYKSLLDAITPKENEQEEMEITFTPGYLEKTEELLENKREHDIQGDETIWESNLRKMKEKQKDKKKLRKEQIQQQIEDEKAEAKKKFKDRKRGKMTEEDRKAKAELELIMMDESGQNQKKGYNLKSLIEDNNSNKKKGKKGRENKGNDEFKVNVDDDRFGALFSNPSDFNIDPTHKSFMKTPGMQTIVKERIKRRAQDNEKMEQQYNTNSNKNNGINSLIESIKKKTNSHPVFKKQKQ